jgi:hypothetical protein
MGQALPELVGDTWAIKWKDLLWNADRMLSIEDPRRKVVLEAKGFADKVVGLINRPFERTDTGEVILFNTGCDEYRVVSEILGDNQNAIREEMARIERLTDGYLNGSCILQPLD